MTATLDRSAFTYSVVIPVYNEVHTILSLIDRVQDRPDRRLGGAAEADHVEVRHAAQQLFALLLGDAARHRDDHVGT